MGGTRGELILKLIVVALATLVVVGPSPLEVKVAIIALAVANLAAPGAMWLARRVGSVAYPGDRHVHTEPTPSSGGLSMYLGFAAAVGYAASSGAWAHAEVWQRQVIGIVIGASAIAALGALDDRLEVPAPAKLVGQFACAALLIPFGVVVAGISNPFAGTWIAFPWWVGWIITVGWVVAITNAINLIDGLDGLAAGVCGIAAFSLAISAAVQGQAGPMIIAAAVCGSTIGFLPYNFHPARVFMGDLGSHFLGYTIAAIAVVGAFKIAASMAILLPLLVLAVPIFDTAFAIARRYRRRQPIFRGDKEHLHHRLLAKGLTQAQTVLVIYAITGLFCFLAYLVSRIR